MIKVSLKPVKQLSDRSNVNNLDLLNQLSKKSSSVNFCSLPDLDLESKKSNFQLDSNIINIKGFNVKDESHRLNKIGLSSIDLPNFKHSGLGFSIDNVLTRNTLDNKKSFKSRNPINEKSEEKENRYDRRARRASLAFPELTTKIKSLYNLKMNVDMELGKMKNNLKKLETKYQKIDKEDKNKNYDYIFSTKFKEFTSLSKIKNIFYQATKNKNNKPFFLSDHEEPKPLALCFSNYKNVFPQIEKYLENEKKKKKVKIPRYLKKKNFNKQN